MSFDTYNRSQTVALFNAFNKSDWISVSCDDNIYTTNTSRHSISHVLWGKIVSFAGIAVAGFADGDRLTTAKFNSPTGIHASKDAVYVADTKNHKIRKISEMTVSTFAGKITPSSNQQQKGHRDGPALEALFDHPTGIFMHGEDMYISDTGNNCIRLISRGIVSTIAIESPAGKPSLIQNPSEICVTKDGTIYVVCDKRLVMVMDGKASLAFEDAKSVKESETRAAQLVLTDASSSERPKENSSKTESELPKSDHTSANKFKFGPFSPTPENKPAASGSGFGTHQFGTNQSFAQQASSSAFGADFGYGSKPQFLPTNASTSSSEQLKSNKDISFGQSPTSQNKPATFGGGFGTHQGSTQQASSSSTFGAEFGNAVKPEHPTNASASEQPKSNKDKPQVKTELKFGQSSVTYTFGQNKPAASRGGFSSNNQGSPQQASAKTSNNTAHSGIASPASPALPFYDPVISVDGNQPIRLASISIMPAYSRLSAEQLRWMQMRGESMPGQPEQIKASTSSVPPLAEANTLNDTKLHMCLMADGTSLLLAGGDDTIGRFSSGMFFPLDQLKMIKTGHTSIANCQIKDNTLYWSDYSKQAILTHSLKEIVPEVKESQLILHGLVEPSEQLETRSSIKFLDANFVVYKKFLEARCKSLLDVSIIQFIEKSGANSAVFAKFVQLLYQTEYPSKQTSDYLKSMDLIDLCWLLFFGEMCNVSEAMLLNIAVALIQKISSSKSLETTTQERFNMMKLLLKFTQIKRDYQQSTMQSSSPPEESESTTKSSEPNQGFSLDNVSSLTSHFLKSIINELRVKRNDVSGLIEDILTSFEHPVAVSLISELFKAEDTEFQVSDLPHTKDSMQNRSASLLSILNAAYQALKSSAKHQETEEEKNTIRCAEDASINNSIISLCKPDFTIILYNNDVFKCHKWILYGRWPYFKKMIDSNLQEAKENLMHLPDDWTSTKLQLFLNYIYLGHIDFHRLADIGWLMSQFNIYDIAKGDPFSPSLQVTPGFEPLVEHCQKMVENINLYNCIDMYDITKRTGNVNRQKESRNFIVKNLLFLTEEEKSRRKLKELDIHELLFGEMSDKKW